MLLYRLEDLAQRLADAWFSLWPRPRPARERVERCGIVSHRGEHDNRTRRENTLTAFAAARAGGVWGIEFDLHWTRDYEPVVLHDPDTRRVFGIDLVVAEVDFADLRARVPEVPSLAEVIAGFGGDLHLMMELKRDPLPDLERKRARLRELFAPLTPVTDYHVLALAPDLFAPMDFAGETAFIAVAELNVAATSQRALAPVLVETLADHFALRRHRRAVPAPGPRADRAPRGPRPARRHRFRRVALLPVPRTEPRRRVDLQQPRQPAGGDPARTAGIKAMQANDIHVNIVPVETFHGGPG